jgi:hypothetical protein
MHSAEFEPTIPASERPQTHALDRAATGIGTVHLFFLIVKKFRICGYYLHSHVGDSKFRSRSVLSRSVNRTDDRTNKQDKQGR